MVGEGSNALDDLRFYRGADFPLLNGETALFGWDVGQGLVIHAACLERGKQLARGMKIEREVGQVVKTDAESQSQQQKKRGNLGKAGGEKGGFHF